MSHEFEDDHGVVTEIEKKTKEPKRWRVVILNDDYTTMEFVVFVLESVFHKTPQEAYSLMLSIHETGSGVAGVFSYEIAEMKTAIVAELSRKRDHPLRCIMEED